MSRKLRYYTRLTYAFLSRFKGLLIIGFLIGLAIFFVSAYLIPRYFGFQKIRIGVTGRFTIDNLPDEITHQISSGLTYINNNGEIEPAIASNWYTHDKGKTWTFEINEGATWQNSENITSSDIKYTFSDVTVSYPNDNTIEFKLNDEYAPFPYVVSRPVFKSGLLGTSDWNVTDIKLNGNFIQELSIKNGKSIKIYKFYPTEESTKMALKLGSIDQIAQVYDPAPFQNWNTLKIEESESTYNIVTLFFNTQDKYLSEKSLRQALYYAIQKDDYKDQRAAGPIPPLSWAYNPQIKTYDYNPERAKELVGDLPEELKTDLNIQLVTTPSLLAVAEKIVQDWKNVGIESHLLVSSTIPTEFQVFLAIFDPPTDPDQYSTWHSTQTSTNISRYKNPRIDKLLEDGRIALDMEERRKIYLDFQRFLLEDVPAAFLYYPRVFKISRN